MVGMHMQTNRVAAISEVPRVLIRNAEGRIIDACRCESDAEAEAFAQAASFCWPAGWTCEALTAGGAQLALHHAPEAVEV